MAEIEMMPGKTAEPEASKPTKPSRDKRQQKA
jgi:hypothetical protein